MEAKKQNYTVTYYHDDSAVWYDCIRYQPGSSNGCCA